MLQRGSCFTLELSKCLISSLFTVIILALLVCIKGGISTHKQSQTVSAGDPEWVHKRWKVFPLWCLHVSSPYVTRQHSSSFSLSLFFTKLQQRQVSTCNTRQGWYSNSKIGLCSHADGTHWSLPHSNKHWTLCWIFMTLRAPRWCVWRWTEEKPVIESGLEHHGRTVNSLAGPLCSLTSPPLLF